jgi:hypothetical protein
MNAASLGKLSGCFLGFHDVVSQLLLQDGKSMPSCFRKVERILDDEVVKFDVALCV